MKHLSSALKYRGVLLWSGALLHGVGDLEPIPARRAKYETPIDNGTFVRPLQQALIKNKRLMDSTVRMLTILAAWGGKETPIETTQGIIARHVGKSVRQVQRMLKDAWREGYLVYAYTKNYRGMITGIRVHLKFDRIFKQKSEPVYKKSSEKVGKRGATLESDTNRNINIYNKRDHDLEKKLVNLGKAMGAKYKFE